MERTAPTIAPAIPARERGHWPKKYPVFGVDVSATDYEGAARRIMAAALRREAAVVTHMAVHPLVLAARDPSYRAVLNSFDIVCPDGQPVRWALNYFQRTDLPDRVYGPDLMLRLCHLAGEQGVGVYLYGSSPSVSQALGENLLKRCPSLRIVGRESPPFRPLTVAEKDAAVERINDSGAGLVFVGLGAPKQDLFAYEHRHRIRAVQMCVGAAFDFHAGAQRVAPAWMQRRGLEWLFRLTQEPRRLWRRYLVTNSAFVMLVLRQALLRGRGGAARLGPQGAVGLGPPRAADIEADADSLVAQR